MTAAILKALLVGARVCRTARSTCTARPVSAERPDLPALPTTACVPTARRHPAELMETMRPNQIWIDEYIGGDSVPAMRIDQLLPTSIRTWRVTYGNVVNGAFFAIAKSDNVLSEAIIRSVYTLYSPKLVTA